MKVVCTRYIGEQTKRWEFNAKYAEVTLVNGCTLPFEPSGLSYAMRQGGIIVIYANNREKGAHRPHKIINVSAIHEIEFLDDDISEGSGDGNDDSR